MSDGPKKGSRGWIGWVLLAFLVLYSLSAGPATLFCQRAHIDDNWLAIPYGPIKWAMDNNEAFKRAFLAYLRLWLKIP